MKSTLGLVFLSIILLSSQAHSNVSCKGKIEKIYKWSYQELISIHMGANGNRWIKLPTKSDEAMAMMAFAAGKEIHIYWSASDVGSCTDGWADNRTLTGFFTVYGDGIN